MRVKSFVLFSVLLLSTHISAKEVYLAIGGSVNNFRTDARILNPSVTDDIQIQAWLLPNGNVDNSSVAPRTITVPKRQMLVLDDVVSSLFGASGLAAIRLSSHSDFIATQRIYAQTAAGTLGQFVPGVDLTQAKQKGVLLQLKSSAAFRTNVGVVNPNAATATVTWTLYDRNNAVIATGAPMSMPPFAVVSPSNLVSGTFFNPGNADLTDAWVSYSSDQPIFAYASVVDNATTDPTFVPAFEDTGAPPPQSNKKAFSISAHQFEFDVTPAFNVSAGDEVTLQLVATDTTHGFTLVGPNGSTLVTSTNIPANRDAITRTFTATEPGTYTYFCTVVCGSGHGQMSGSFTVSPR